MVHRHDRVAPFQLLPGKRGIRRQRAADGQAFFAKPADYRRDNLVIFATQVTAFAGVRR